LVLEELLTIPNMKHDSAMNMKVEMKKKYREGGTFNKLNFEQLEKACKW
jgi:hypothetical protein